ncbi:MAG: hypothetical protein M0R46_00165 [Candidatus Muirbacterium halophilum]|nr:hypothetical protein [Candidatus Muirbacterium halophilum]MCK9474306.1 hypothetical protein [Candidatus Muirbacterium halophilum]
MKKAIFIMLALIIVITSVSVYADNNIKSNDCDGGVCPLPVDNGDCDGGTCPLPTVPDDNGDCDGGTCPLPIND